MADIKNINYDYYGTKEQWVNVLGSSDPANKAGINGQLKNYYDTSKLLLNDKLDESIKMFGIKNPIADRLHKWAVYYEDDNIGQVVTVKTFNEVGSIGYFMTSNYSANQDEIRYGSLTFNYANQHEISGKGLEKDLTFTGYNQIYPLVNFNYTHHINLIYVSYLKNFREESDGYHYDSSATTTLDDFYEKLNDETNKIFNYFLLTYSGISNNNRQYSGTNMMYVLDDDEYPIGNREVWKYKTFTYLPKVLNSQGAGSKGLSFSYSTQNKTFTFCCNGNPDYWKKEDVFDKSGNKLTVLLFNGDKEYLLTQACFSGLYFTGDQTTAQRATLGKDMTDEKVYTPIITDGIITGEYVTGSKGAEQPSAEWTDDIREKTGFTGPENIDPTKYTDLIKLNKPKLKTAGAFNTFYAMNENQLKSLANNLWTADDTKFEEILQGLKLMGENPMNAIISLNLFPFSIPPLAETAIDEEIKIGRVLMGCNGTKVKNIDSVIDLGSIKLRNYFDNFLNYEPYSTAFLYIPYCNTIQISLNDFIGKTISIKLIVDYMTGACTAVVFADGIPIVYKNGVIAQSISVTGTDSATTASNVINSTLNQITNFSSFTAGALSGNVAGVVTSGVNILGKSLDYSAERTIYQSQGASSSGIESFLPQKPYFVINLPKYNLDSSFGQYHGYKTDFYSFINDLTGYVETDTPILSNILCTDDEKTEIQNLLMSGVYV
mgnify:FL=1